MPLSRTEFVSNNSIFFSYVFIWQYRLYDGEWCNSCGVICKSRCSRLSSEMTFNEFFGDDEYCMQEYSFWRWSSDTWNRYACFLVRFIWLFMSFVQKESLLYAWRFHWQLDFCSKQYLNINKWICIFIDSLKYEGKYEIINKIMIIEKSEKKTFCSRLYFTQCWYPSYNNNTKANLC